MAYQFTEQWTRTPWLTAMPASLLTGAETEYTPRNHETIVYRSAEFTERYEGLMRCYGLKAEKIQAGHGNENGDVEQRHHRFKRAVEQELLLRGSRDFASVDAYRSFLQALFARLNAGRRQRLVEEMAVMRELPERRMESPKRERVKVDSGSLIYVDRNVYSVPSRLIGEVVEARLTMDQVEVWYGQRKVPDRHRGLRGPSFRSAEAS
jgi:hypothetical protein